MCLWVGKSSVRLFYEFESFYFASQSLFGRSPDKMNAMETELRNGQWSFILSARAALRVKEKKYYTTFIVICLARR